MPYALDNGAFVAWTKGRPFNEVAFLRHLGRSKLCSPPIWIVVPDVVGDAAATMRLWERWAPLVSGYGPLAFAAQDGMEPTDVPKNAHCVFVGGTTEWKLENAHRFKGVAPKLHIARVNHAARLFWAEKICHADSVDGTGFFRGDQRQIRILTEWIEGPRQMSFSGM